MVRQARGDRGSRCLLLAMCAASTGVLLLASACSGSHRSESGPVAPTSELMTNPWTSATQVSETAWRFVWIEPSCQLPVTSPTVSYTDRTVTVTFYSHPPSYGCFGGIARQQSLVELVHPLAERHFVDGACLAGQPYQASTNCETPKVVTRL